MKLKKKILITGAFGFIGSFFYKKIIKLKNLEIYTTTNRENLLKKKNSFRNFRIKKNFKIDLANKKKVKLLLNKIKPDVIYHFAGLSDHQFCENNKKIAKLYNSVVTRNIVNSMPKKTKIIFFSTDKIYSNNYKLLNSSKFIPRTFLASEKLKSENYIRNATKMFFILRLPIVHSDGFNKNLSTVDYFLNSLRNGEKISVFDNIKRSFLEVNELVYFLKSLIQNNNYGTYNIGSKLFFYSDRIKILSKKYKIYKKKKIILIRGDIKPDIQYFDISKTQKIFNKFFY